jgi:hypothetical protein
MNNDKKYWMKRRRYGWGWTPTTIQGLLFLAVQLCIIFAAILMLPKKPSEPSVSQLIGFFMIVGLVIVSIILVGSVTSPRPHWRWGKKSTDNTDEDF